MEAEMTISIPLTAWRYVSDFFEVHLSRIIVRNYDYPSRDLVYRPMYPEPIRKHRLVAVETATTGTQQAPFGSGIGSDNRYGEHCDYKYTNRPDSRAPYFMLKCRYTKSDRPRAVAALPKLVLQPENLKHIGIVKNHLRINSLIIQLIALSAGRT
jgi:hypothetical protein